MHQFNGGVKEFSKQKEFKGNKLVNFSTHIFSCVETVWYYNESECIVTQKKNHWCKFFHIINIKQFAWQENTIPFKQNKIK